MTTQATIDFTTRSPINVERMKGQNRRLYDYLLTGASINCFSQAKQDLRIGYLNSRIADLVEMDVPISKQRVLVKDVDGEDVSVVEYRMDVT